MWRSADRPSDGKAVSPLPRVAGIRRGVGGEVVREDAQPQANETGTFFVPASGEVLNVRYNGEV